MHSVIEPAALLILALPLLFLGWLAAVVVLLFKRKWRTAIFVGLVAPLFVFLALIVGLYMSMLGNVGPIARPDRIGNGAEVLSPADRNSAERPPSPPAPLPQAGEGSLKPAKRLAPASSAEKTLPSSEKSPPAWVAAPPHWQEDAYQTAVVVGPYTSRAECDAHLADELQKAVGQFAEMCLGEPISEKNVLPAEELRRLLIRDQWEEIGQYSVGPMVQLHVLLQFDRKMKERILELHRRAVIDRRLWVAGIVTIGVLGFLTGLFGFLKITGRPHAKLQAVFAPHGRDG
jgi:hypothetical protein